jgi:hypothetical protein
VVHLLQPDETDGGIQCTCIILSIGNLVRGAESAIPVLLEELRLSRYPTVAGEALGNIGPAAAEAVPMIIKKISAGDLSYDLPLIEALGKFQSKAALPMLIAIAKGTEGNGSSRRKHDERAFASDMWKHCAVEALGHMGPDAGAAVPELIGLLKGEGSGNLSGLYFSERIIRTFGSIGPDAREALPVLREIAGRSKQPAGGFTIRSPGNR